MCVSGQRQVHRVKKKEEGDKSKAVSAKKERQLMPMTISLQRLYLEIGFFAGTIIMMKKRYDEVKSGSIV